MAHSILIRGTKGELVGFSVDWEDKGYIVTNTVQEGNRPQFYPTDFVARLDFACGQVAALTFVPYAGVDWKAHEQHSISGVRGWAQGLEWAWRHSRNKDPMIAPWLIR
ncbi:hypothetical protein MUN82_08790 [Hymenobacter aerilatus]|uniref:Uncharacterized protein n=1 Tax=Hymenobacter aerilatus TaxID=2932251 RepID=A0A8T9T5Q8_9BACT|nr:hypothetical protein [Hymenobacter aerilatus]UOR07179.1 hypothetical protein MUN82_08790 [Hymenobacter aerilatus]